MIPRSEWSAQQSLKYAQKSLEIGVEKSEQNFLPLYTYSYSMVITCLNDAFSEVFEKEARPVESQLLQQKLSRNC